jgi:hypothetical protein
MGYGQLPQVGWSSLEHPPSSFPTFGAPAATLAQGALGLIFISAMGQGTGAFSARIDDVMCWAKRDAT